MAKKQKSKAAPPIVADQKKSQLVQAKTSKSESSNDTEQQQVRLKPEGIERRRAGLPPVWFDNISIAIRHDTPVVSLIFESAAMDIGAYSEVARLMTTLSHLEKMISVFQSTIEKYKSQQTQGDENKKE